MASIHSYTLPYDRQWENRRQTEHFFDRFAQLQRSVDWIRYGLDAVGRRNNLWPVRGRGDETLQVFHANVANGGISPQLECATVTRE